jgi:hypothetical protein
MESQLVNRYWIGVASRDHVQLGVSGGFAQLNHGRQAPLKRFQAGDGIIYYSPRLTYPSGEPCQAFTALGVVRSGEVYQGIMSADFKPFRIDVDFFDVSEAPIRPLIDQLSFIRNKRHWGAAFRFGLISIPESDFRLIADAMDVPPGRWPQEWKPST